MIRQLILAATCGLAIACSATSDVADIAPSGWAVDSVPITRIGDDDALGEPMLGLAVGASRLSDGSVVVADREMHSLRFFPQTAPSCEVLDARDSARESLATSLSCGAAATHSSWKTLSNG